jgi:transposase InsO family protein
LLRSQAAFAEGEVQALQARLYHETSEILAERWDKIPDRRRPQYRPELRYRILRLKKVLAWSRRETAAMFRVSVQTIARWEREAEAHPEKQTVGSLVKPQPPTRRYADVVRHLIHTMALTGFGGNRLIAQTLARAGWKLAQDTVRRIRKERPCGNPTTDSQTRTVMRAVKARYPGHILMADLTDVPGFLGLFRFKVVAIMDVFSRMPLAAMVFYTDPPSSAITELFKKAIQTFGFPRHFVSDQGAQFTAHGFRQMLKTLDIRQRFVAIGKTGSIALIERLWRTLKNTASLRSFKPLLKQELERRLELGLIYYACLRPHQGLGGFNTGRSLFWNSAGPSFCCSPTQSQAARRTDQPPFLDRLSGP